MISKNQLKFVKQLELKKHRRTAGVFVAEGPKVVGDLLACGFEAKQIFATEEWNEAAVGTANRQLVSEEELRKLSFLQHPQQVLGVFQLPQQADSAAEPDGLVLALDGIQDPGNLGTIIRIADWFGIGSIFCSEDTADAWSPKVVQATMGSIARVHINYIDLKKWLSETGKPVYGTLLDGESLYEQQLLPNGVIVMGNEGNGISQAIRPLIGHRLFIPRYREGAESLNVAIATAITCAEFRRREGTA